MGLRAGPCRSWPWAGPRNGLEYAGRARPKIFGPCTSLVAGADADKANQFMDCIEDNFCTQHVTVPTTEHNILDLVISSDHQMVNEVQVLDRFDTSDNNIISVELNFSKMVAVSSKIRLDYNRADWDKIRHELSQVDWDKELDNNILDSWQNFKRNISEVEQKYLPTKEISVNSKRHKPIWMTYKAAKFVKKKRNL